MRQNTAVKWETSLLYKKLEVVLHGFMVSCLLNVVPTSSFQLKRLTREGKWVKSHWFCCPPLWMSMLQTWASGSIFNQPSVPLPLHDQLFSLANNAAESLPHCRKCKCLEPLTNADITRSFSRRGRWNVELLLLINWNKATLATERCWFSARKKRFNECLRLETAMRFVEANVPSMHSRHGNLVCTLKSVGYLISTSLMGYLFSNKLKRVSALHYWLFIPKLVLCIKHIYTKKDILKVRAVSCPSFTSRWRRSWLFPQLQVNKRIGKMQPPLLQSYWMCLDRGNYLEGSNCSSWSLSWETWVCSSVGK